MQIRPEEWQAIYAAINVDFKMYKGGTVDVVQQGADWYEDLRRFSLAAVADAWREYRRTGTKRPHLSDLIAGAREYEKRVRSALTFAAKQNGIDEHDSHHCPCGCGGQLWARILYDFTGNPRMDAQGGFLTRYEMECFGTHRGSLRPSNPADHFGDGPDGVPIYRVQELMHR